jgi:hypothetical protein
MGWRVQKTRDELHAFYKEIVVENGPRYKDPKEWHHLWVDFWVSLFSMSYTLGHIIAFGIPLGVILCLVF